MPQKSFTCAHVNCQAQYFNSNNCRQSTTRTLLPQDCLHAPIRFTATNLYDFPPDKLVWRHAFRRLQLTIRKKPEYQASIKLPE